MAEYAAKTCLYRIRCANSGFLKNGLIYGGHVACPRIALFRDCGVQSPIEDRAYKTFALGHASEEVFKGECERNNWPYVQEKFHRYDVAPNTDLAFAADFIVDGMPYELKSVSSTAQYEKIFINGHYKTANLAQLIQEMVQLEVSKGVLRYTNYVYHSEKKSNISTINALAKRIILAKELENAKLLAKQILDSMPDKWKAAPVDRDFVVTIDEQGVILVDGLASEFTIFDLLDHRQMLIDMFENQELPTVNFAKEDWPPCKGCFFEQHCATSTEKNTLKFVKEFVDNSR